MLFYRQFNRKRYQLYLTKYLYYRTIKKSNPKQNIHTLRRSVMTEKEKDRAMRYISENFTEWLHR